MHSHGAKPRNHPTTKNPAYPRKRRQRSYSLFPRSLVSVAQPFYTPCGCFEHVTKSGYIAQIASYPCSHISQHRQGCGVFLGKLCRGVVVSDLRGLFRQSIRARNRARRDFPSPDLQIHGLSWRSPAATYRQSLVVPKYLHVPQRASRF